MLVPETLGEGHLTLMVSFTIMFQASEAADSGTIDRSLIYMGGCSCLCQEKIIASFPTSGKVAAKWVARMKTRFMTGVVASAHSPNSFVAPNDQSTRKGAVIYLSSTPARSCFHFPVGSGSGFIE